MIHEFAISALSEKYNLPFRNEELLDICFTNPSTSGHSKNTEEGINNHNARTNLVIIGKAVLELCVTAKAFLEYNHDEKTQFLCAKTLKLLFKSSFLTNNELITECALLVNNEIPNEKDVSDELMYSFIGYIYYRFGFDAIYSIFNQTCGSLTGLKINADEFLDYKTMLQEKAQALSNKIAPYYTVIAEQGPDNEKTFTVKVSVADKYETGIGRSKKSAEVAAAKAFLLHYFTKDVNQEKIVGPKRFILSKRIETVYKNKNVGTKWFSGNRNIIMECLASKAFSNEALHDKYCSSVKYVPLGMACFGVALIDVAVFSKKDAIYDNLQLTQYKGEKMNKIADIFYQVIQDISPLMKFSNGERRSEKLRNLSAIESVKALLSVGYITNKMSGASINHIHNLYPAITVSLFGFATKHRSNENDICEDPASLIMQICQAMNWAYEYTLLNESGPRHAPIYTTLCTVKINQTEDISATANESSIKLGRRKASELVLNKIVHKIRIDDTFLHNVLTAVLYSRIKAASKVSVLRNLLIPAGIDIFGFIQDPNLYFYFLELYIKNNFSYSPDSFKLAIDCINSSDDIRYADTFFQNYPKFASEEIVMYLINKSNSILS